MKIGVETGSLMNYVLADSGPEPKVGMGATVLHWSDRSAGTIIKVTKNTFVVQEDKATRTDDNGMSESQSYDFVPDPNGATYTFRRTKRGWRS